MCRTKIKQRPKEINGAPGPTTACTERMYNLCILLLHNECMGYPHRCRETRKYWWDMSRYHAMKGLMKILSNRPGGALGGRGAYWKGGIYNFNFIYLLIFFFSFLISYIFLSLFFFIFFSHIYFHFSFEGGEHWTVEHWEGRGFGSRALGRGALGVVEHWEGWSH